MPWLMSSSAWEASYEPWVELIIPTDRPSIRAKPSLICSSKPRSSSGPWGIRTSIADGPVAPSGLIGSVADAGATPQKKRAAAATTAAVSRYIGVATPRR